MKSIVLAAALAMLASSATAQQRPSDPATDLRENFLALTIAYNHAMRAIDLYMAQSGQVAQELAASKESLAASESSKKWILDNWVPPLQ